MLPLLFSLRCEEDKRHGGGNTFREAGKQAAEKKDKDRGTSTVCTYESSNNNDREETERGRQM